MKKKSTKFDLEFIYLFLVFELLKGGEILEIPTENPMSEKEAWSAFREIVHGLDYRKKTALYYTGCKLLQPD